MNKRYLTILITLTPTLLIAHGSHGSGILAGVTHPILGVDHNVAIISCAILGYITDSKNWFLLPLGFLVSMIIGGLIGIGKEANPSIEMFIACSVLINGILIAYNKRLPSLALLLLMTVFGFVHGYAHGAEMPESNTALKYVTGYVMGAIILSLIGYMLGKWTKLNRNANQKIKALLGGIVIGCGTMMVLS